MQQIINIIFPTTNSILLFLGVTVDHNSPHVWACIACRPTEIFILSLAHAHSSYIHIFFTFCTKLKLDDSIWYACTQFQSPPSISSINWKLHQYQGENFKLLQILTGLFVTDWFKSFKLNFPQMSMMNPLQIQEDGWQSLAYWRSCYAITSCKKTHSSDLCTQKSMDDEDYGFGTTVHVQLLYVRWRKRCVSMHLVKVQFCTNITSNFTCNTDLYRPNCKITFCD